MDFQKLLGNKTLLISIVAGILVIAVLGLTIALVSGGGGNKGEGKTVDKEAETKIKGTVELVTTDNIGKIIELEALLARHKIQTTRMASGSKITLALKEKSTLKQRDEALLLIVQSGLADANIGLEVFDKGDFTSTKDDKRIRLARAINGELSRLIRKIKPIENASVFISIAEPTMFTSMEKPTTATVQLVLPIGEKLTKDKVRAITNLLLGSVSGLELDNISITDTNGNVYTSMASAGNDALEKIEENDEYMKAKVQAQLDKLLGKGNYVVTVSTYLRQVPMERSSVIYDPNRNVVLSEQEFTESLGDKNNESGQITNAVSLYLPSGLPQSANTSQNRSYSRVAQEKQYGATKTQVAEYLKPGMIEDISIAVTIENNAIAEEYTGEKLQDLKNLIATAASPKVDPNNVEIILAESTIPSTLGEKTTKNPVVESSGNPWWTMVVVILVLVAIGWFILSKKLAAAKAEHANEIQSLRNLTNQQENKLEEVNQRAQILLAQQDQLQQSLNTIRQTPQIAVAPVNHEIVNEIKQTVEDDEEEVAIQLKNWIESDD